MSEQSPESAASSSPEPSMEDILASIRRMIDEDDSADVTTGEEATQVAKPLEAALDPSTLVEPVEVEIEDAKAEIEMIEEPAETVAAAPADSLGTETDFADFESDFSFDDDLTIPDAAAASEESTEDLIDIDDLIAEVEGRIKADMADTATETETGAGSTVSQDTDIEQIKSLMAELTDDAGQDEDISAADEDELDQILDDIADIEMNDDLAVEIDLDTSSDDDFNVLLQIAQEAKADAKAVAAAGTGVAAVSAAALVSPPKSAPKREPEAETKAELQQSKDIEIKNKETPEEETPAMPQAAEENIIDNEVEEATTSAFASLASVVERKDDVVTSGPAIGDLVKEALRPMLKDWLDKNLKGIVERAVAKEIKRIADTK